jgi:hypothetical protein
MYKMKFMFDWGSGICLWSTNKASEDKFGGYPVSTDDLPVSLEMKEELEHLIDWHDEALNWDDPADDLLWNDTQVQEFLAAAKKSYLALCDALGPDYEIEFYDHM